ncbi:unnamed protein product [Auanema sp. JU1783]|nr:unnamed protein product [Auanema sp. JU1783]
MAKGKLYGKKDNFRTQKVLIAAKLGKSDVQLAGETAPADKFPLGVTPAYEGEALLFGAESVALHVSGESGKNLAEIVQWLQWAEASLLPNVLGYVLPSVSAAKLEASVVASYKNELFAQLSIFNDILLSKTFLVGNRLSLADVSVALDLLPAFQHVLDEGARKKFGNVLRWFNTIVNQPAVNEVVGNVVFASKVAQFTEAEFTKFAAKLSTVAGEKNECKVVENAQPIETGTTVNVTDSSTGKKKKKNKKKNEKKETKKAEPKAAAPKPEADEDDVPAPKESKDPFAEMPKGTFNLDAFKRCYSNEDTATKAIPHFWENFDAENNSIWYCEYKFPTELTLAFMSCNLISGMYQRLEKLKKNAFASMILFGTDNNSSISGVWTWKGQELAFPLCDDWQIDYESYEWKKLDPKDEKTKKLVNEYLLWEGDFDGKKFNQGKIFK